jgi:hypothetical protein
MIVGSYEPHCSKKTSKYTKKKYTHFATKSSTIIICSRRARSTLQKRSLLYKTQKNYKQTKNKKTLFCIVPKTSINFFFTLSYFEYF